MQAPDTLLHICQLFPAELFQKAVCLYFRKRQDKKVHQTADKFLQVYCDCQLRIERRPRMPEMISNKDITNTVIVFCNENNYLFSAFGLIFIVASDERTAFS